VSTSVDALIRVNGGTPVSSQPSGVSLAQSGAMQGSKGHLSGQATVSARRGRGARASQCSGLRPIGSFLANDQFEQKVTGSAPVDPHASLSYTVASNSYISRKTMTL
jgi:hypothetical protein